MIIERDTKMIVFNTQGTPMKIINTIDKDFIMVEFLDQFHYQLKTRYQNFVRGTVMNPYDRTICGVGYIGVGKYKGDVRTTDFRKKMNNCWADMIRRCYSEKDRSLHNAYKDCYVADVWHNFQNFAEWYEENFYQVDTERMHLDKDILYKNNSFYSPETCVIVPQRINMMFMSKSRTIDQDLPQGINRTTNNCYSAMYNTKSLGVYDSLEKAIDVYNKEKYKAICKVAEEYKGKIPTKLYEALYNWIPDGISNIKVSNVKKNNIA